MESAVPDVRRDAEYVFSAMVGMARCAVPARVVAGGTNFRATPAFEGVAPLHAARTSQRDVPTTLNKYVSGPVRAAGGGSVHGSLLLRIFLEVRTANSWAQITA